MDYNKLKISINSSFEARNNLDTKRFNEELRQFYIEGKNNPSVAKMIMREELERDILQIDKENNKLISEINLAIQNRDFIGGNYGIYKFNLTKAKLKYITNAGMILNILRNGLEQNLNTASLKYKQQFDSAFEKLYPKTGYIRKYLYSLTDLKFEMLQKYCRK